MFDSYYFYSSIAPTLQGLGHRLVGSHQQTKHSTAQTKRDTKTTRKQNEERRIATRTRNRYLVAVVVVVVAVVAVVVVVVVVVVVAVAAVVLTSTPRIIKSVVTGQAPVTLEWRNTPRKNTQTKTKVVHAYIIADATNASARKILK